MVSIPAGGVTWSIFKNGSCSLVGNQRVGIFPPKSKILFSLRISFIWYHKISIFDWPSPLGWVTWSKYTECWPVRRKERIKRMIIIIKKYRVLGYFSGRISPKRYEIFEFRFHCGQGQESRYQMLQTTSLSFLSFQRYKVVNIMNCECWPIRRCGINTRANVFARLTNRKCFCAQKKKIHLDYLNHLDLYGGLQVLFNLGRNS